MEPMKTDMAAGGAVAAAMAALREAGVRVRVTALVPRPRTSPAARPCARRTSSPLRRSDHRGAQHRRRGAAGARRRARLRRRPSRPRPARRPGDADRRGVAGARHAGTAALFSTDEELAAGCSRPARAAASACGGCRSSEDYGPAMDSDVADLRNTSGDPHLRGSIRALRSSCASSPAAGRGPTWTSPARPGRPGATRVTRGGTGFGARLLVRWLEGEHSARAQR